MSNLLVSSALHDIAKLFIADEILNKLYSSTQDEYEIMKMHSIKGFEYIKNEKLDTIAINKICKFIHI